MLRKAVLGMVLLTGVYLQAQTIALNGKITDQSGKAVTGAIVKLKSVNLSDTTDAAGAYSLTASTLAVNEMAVLRDRNAISMKNGIVEVNLLQPARVRIELFDMHGKLLEKVVGDKPTVPHVKSNIPFCLIIKLKKI